MRLTDLMRLLKMSNDSDNRIDLSSLDQMTGSIKFAIGDSPKSRYGEIRIPKIILRSGNREQIIP